MYPPLSCYENSFSPFKLITMVLVENKKLLFPSKIENILLVENLVDDVCEQLEIKEKLYGNILVSITEAVSNGILHGNKSNPNKNIEVSYKIKNNTLYFAVKDQGLGFDYNNLPDPTDFNNIEKLMGRGVFLMKHLCDNVYFEDNGSKVILGFKLS
jgi:serine/threonine-protein kinase RsbW